MRAVATEKEPKPGDVWFGVNHSSFGEGLTKYKVIRATKTKVILSKDGRTIDVNLRTRRRIGDVGFVRTHYEPSNQELVSRYNHQRTANACRYNIERLLSLDKLGKLSVHDMTAVTEFIDARFPSK